MAANPSGVKPKKDQPQTPGADSLPATKPDEPKADAAPETPLSTGESPGRPEPAAEEKPETPAADGTAKRTARSRLQAELATKKCPLCQAVGCWKVTGTFKAEGRTVRYVKCTACGRTDKLVM